MRSESFYIGRGAWGGVRGGGGGGGGGRRRRRVSLSGSTQGETRCGVC